MDLSIIIVNWNSKDHLRRCLASVLSPPLELESEIIVADAGSFDGCGAMLAAEFPHVRFIQIHKNLGFARANNIAAREARGIHLLFLNPDTEVTGRAIELMHRAIRRLPRAGVIGAKLLNPDGTIQTSCIQAFPTVLNQVLSCEYLRRKWPKSRLWGMSAFHSASALPQEVDAISGACVMTVRSTFEVLGGFSEDFFMYAEDIDLSYRYHKAGYSNYYVPEATVLHYGGSSSGQAPSGFAVVMARESMWRFLRKTRGHGYALAYRCSLLAAATGRILFGLGTYLLRPSSRTGSMVMCAKWLDVLLWSLGRDCSAKHHHSP